MHADERDWLSEESRLSLEGVRRPPLEFLVSMLKISNDTEDLEYIAYCLLAAAGTKRAGA
jgi:hypothetical protein